MDVHSYSGAAVPALAVGSLIDASEEGAHYRIAQFELELSVDDVCPMVHGLLIWSQGIQSTFISGSLYVYPTITFLSDPVLGLLPPPLGDRLSNVCQGGEALWVSSSARYPY